MGGAWRDCASCEPQFGPRGIVRLSPDNQEAWELYDLIYHLGLELAATLSPLDLSEDEAWGLAQRFRLIAQYYRLQELSRQQAAAPPAVLGRRAPSAPTQGLIRPETLRTL